MPTMIFSAPSKYWKSRCTNQLKPETSVNGEQCLACVVPEVVPVELPPECGGTSDWQWSEGSFTWTMIDDNCVGGGTPEGPAPGVVGLEDGQILTLPCDCP